MNNELNLKPARTVREVAKEMERRIKALGCKDDCDNCTLEVCARDGNGALLYEDGSIAFLN